MDLLNEFSVSFEYVSIEKMFKNRYKVDTLDYFLDRYSEGVSADDINADIRIKCNELIDLQLKLHQDYIDSLRLELDRGCPFD
ncbi:MAG: hypothetical protein RR238_05240 [Lachnospiraceae bacterium]